jgi:hypothetical protein
LDCLPLFTSGRVRLIDNARLVAQFAGLERRTFPTGKDRIDHGRAGRDDLCNACAGALTLAARRAVNEVGHIAPAVLSRDGSWSDGAAAPRTAHQGWANWYYGGGGDGGFDAIGGMTRGPPPGSAGSRRGW